jgi:uncharacterized protein YndB with AHSA1/START domain
LSGASSGLAPAAGRHVVSETRVIAAPRQRLFDFVADPAMHPRIDGSGTVVAPPAGAPERLGPGVRFGMGMRMGLPYRTSNRVVEFDEGRRIGWAHFSRAVWRWEFADVDGGTEVTESFDWSRARVRPMMRRFARGNAASMRRSLERLEQLAAED